ncbi:MAG: 5'-methylthioadenosine/S-adenosylhomocysteine nucleosidase [Treponema sp.]|jgi:adenosylhomocysteine nucleosidase|nr:5'-methylthioadenosine/S-adenosylhomocysteine nucleosidase [Treponema sp.]
MTVGIIGAMEKEIELLRGLMRDVSGPDITCCERGGFSFTRGKLDGKDAVLLRCGIGKVNAAVGTALLIDHYRPDVVIHTGSAGGIGAGLSFGDVVIGEGLLYHDVDVTVFNYEPGQIPGMPAVYPVPEDLIEKAERAVDELTAEGVLPAAFHHTRGIIGSADAFMHDERKIAEIARRFPAMRAVEMEGAGVAQACFLFKTPCLVIRALSDVAGSESPMTHDEFLPVAAKNSCEIVRRIVSYL